ncbi:MAG: DUF3037 domain-containing protein [Paludisphaera borealis]|uniref:DUF3037 domain-containing protein n=1 Tax=Paludisphaera borealis TaxID=1387353 RepID=UPI00284FAD55|nr:DUF3037 domain-containing protein [Paludisphaera borealis]MDR3620949.1 DUF3037 domain-containing protein [Paludisphaera borealis]
MNQYFYSLIRFVPDLERMEPFNVGIVLQGQGKLDFKLDPHVAKRKDVDTVIFRKWRSFLDDEIRGDPVPFLQPPKHSRGFLEHLSGLCDQTLVISKPLFLSERPEEPFDEVLQRLYDRLVTPLGQQKKDQAIRPTSTFKEFEDAKQFRKRGMKKHPYIEFSDAKRWNAYRQVLNGENLVIDKIEVANTVGQTADEIQKLSSGVGAFLDRFLNESYSSVPPRYFLIADELEDKFTEQTDEDYEAMKAERETVLQLVTGHGGRIISKPEEVQGLAEDIDRKLPTIEECQKKAG